MLKKIRARYNQYLEDHDIDREEAATYVVLAAVTSGLLALTVAAAVQETKRINEENEWAAGELADGRQVYRLENGSLLSTESATLKI